MLGAKKDIDRMLVGDDEKKKDKDPFNSSTEASNSSDDEVVPKLKFKFSLEDVYSWIEKAFLSIKR